jgi:fatty acid-binding protein DegV
MTPVAVVADTTHYLPRALADMREIHQVSLYVGWEGEMERELEMGDFERFYERLRTDPELVGCINPIVAVDATVLGCSAS